MSLKPKKRQSLEEILQSVSDNLFPEKLGKKKVKINSADCMGDTPLHVMTWRNDVYAVKLLIESGAKLNAIGDMSETPLHVAVGQENINTIEILLKAGAKSNLKSEFGETALERAEKKGGEIARIFKKY